MNGTYAISGPNQTPLTDGRYIAYRAIMDGDPLNENEVEWTGMMPMFPAWDATNSRIVSTPNLYDQFGNTL